MKSVTGESGSHSLDLAFITFYKGIHSHYVTKSQEVWEMEQLQDCNLQRDRTVTDPRLFFSVPLKRPDPEPESLNELQPFGSFSYVRMRSIHLPVV